MLNKCAMLLWVGVRAHMVCVCMVWVPFGSTPQELTFGCWILGWVGWIGDGTAGAAEGKFLGIGHWLFANQ